MYIYLEMSRAQCELQLYCEIAQPGGTQARPPEVKALPEIAQETSEYTNKFNCKAKAQHRIL